jgi:hypothetical protein
MTVMDSPNPYRDSNHIEIASIENGQGLDGYIYSGRGVCYDVVVENDKVLAN